MDILNTTYLFIFVIVIRDLLVFVFSLVFVLLLMMIECTLNAPTRRHNTHFSPVGNFIYAFCLPKTLIYAKTLKHKVKIVESWCLFHKSGFGQ